jgi:hypothetical protein
MIGKTAAYTILKNEAKYIEKWLYYTKRFDYRVLLDTGSTDGSWEMLQEEASKDKNLIIEQKIFDPWIFNVARNYNLDMVPADVELCFEPDMDEYFSINAMSELEKVYDSRPDVHNFTTTRLDIYSEVVAVGPESNQLPSNKIHKHWDENGNLLYKWQFAIYECLGFQPKDRNEVELYLPNVYLVHDQDFTKPRPTTYLNMLLDANRNDPEECWYLWFLCNHYFRERDLDNFIKFGCDFIKYNKTFDGKYKEVLGALTHMYRSPESSPEQKNKIETVIKGRSI